MKGNLKHITALAVTGIVFILLVSGNPVSGKNAISFNNEGWAFLEKGDHMRAILSFKNALKQNQKYLDALTGLGYAYYEVEAYEQAAEVFTDALKVDGKSHNALTGLGFAFIGMGNIHEALGFFNRAIEISGENIKARYGIAYLYYVMGKKLWAERKLQSILRIDPYNLDSLLLMAAIKQSNGRLEDARHFAEKAIDSAGENPRGHVVYGEILLEEYLKEDKSDFLPEAIHSFNNALSIQPHSFQANRFMGNISLITGNYEQAVAYYSKAIEIFKNGSVLYNLAVAYDRAGRQDEALQAFLNAYKISPADSILRTRLEDFLVLRDYKIGHPARILFSNDHLQAAIEREKKNLPDEAVMYLRRVLMLNPMDRKAREQLMEYYEIQGFQRFYINELKDLNRLFSERNYRDRLTLEIMKRRDSLYHKEGYSQEDPPRDVPEVAVMDFYTSGGISSHIDTGEVFATNLTFSLGQFGRMKEPGIRLRQQHIAGLNSSPVHFEKSLEALTNRVRQGLIPPIDYIIYGNYREEGGMLSVECHIMDFHKGIIIASINLSEKGRENLPVLSLRLSRRIYDVVPFTGRVLKLKDQGIVVNLGLYDGIAKDSMLVLQKITSGDIAKDVRKKIYFKVKEANTIISYAEPVDRNDLDEVGPSDIVYPYKRKRAKLIK